MRRITILLIAICCDIALYAQTNTINKAQKTAIEKPQPAVIPFWPTSLNSKITEMSKQPQDEADNIITNNAPEKAVHLLTNLAKQKSSAERDAILARILINAEHATLTPEERYLILRDADALTSNDNLRSKIILEMGNTHCIQALAYIRKYYCDANLSDALAIALTEIITVPLKWTDRSLN